MQSAMKKDRKRKEETYVSTQTSPAFSSVEILKIAAATQQQVCLGAVMWGLDGE